MKRLLILVVYLVTFKSIVSGFVPDTILMLEFPALPKSNYFLATAKIPTTKCSVYIPTNFCDQCKIPVILWIDGGSGGAGDRVEYIKKIVGKNDFILINFPLFKKNVEALLPDSSNYWPRLRIRNQDSEILWNSYKMMLDSIFRLIPQIDKTNAYMGGFSNGAHATAVLLNRSEHEITRYFNKFFFVEGGDGLENYSVLSNRQVLYMQGTELTYPNWVKSFFLNAKKNMAKARFVYMKGVGHNFPEKYYDILCEWISTERKSHCCR